MLSKTPHRRGSRPERPPVPHRGETATGRHGAAADRRPAATPEVLPPDVIVALVTGSALILALATGAVMIEDSRSVAQATAEPAVAVVQPPAPAPEAVEPRFPDQPQSTPQPQPQGQPQPLRQRGEQAHACEPKEPANEALAAVQPQGPTTGPRPFPAPVAPSVELLGPAPKKTAPKTEQAPPDMRFAVYLASFSSNEQALAGWQILQRRYQRPLAGLAALVKRGKSKQGESVFRLFAGPFESLQAAAQRCSVLSTATANCKPADLSQASAEGSQSWD